MPTPPSLSLSANTPTPAPNRRRAGLWLTVIIALCTLAAITTYRQYASSVRSNTQALLQSLARSRATAIRAHLDERSADAWVLARRDRILRALGDGTGNRDPKVLGELLDALRDVSSAYGYHNVILFGRDRRVIAQLHPDTLLASENAVLESAMLTGRAQPILLHRADEGNVEYGVVAPIWIARDSAGPADGALYLVLDVDTRLLPIIGEGVPSLSFESLLVQISGDSATAFSSNTREDNNPVRPLVLSRAVADQLLRNDNGLDHRGVPTIHGVSVVPRTPWTVITKIDRDEAESLIRLAATAIGVTFVLIISLAFTFTRSAGRRQRLRAIQEREELASRTLRVVQTSTDGYVTHDETGRFLDVNDALAEISGYSTAELLSMSLADVKVVHEPADIARTIERIRGGRRERYVSQWRHKAGHIVDLDVSATFIPDERGGWICAFVRDISESTAAQRRLERVNRLYAFLNHTGEALFRAKHRDEAFRLVCEAAAAEGKFALAWIGVVDETAGVITPAVAVGDAREYVETLTITTDPALPTSQGPSGRCISERRPIVADDFLADPSTSPWHAAAQQYGLRSSAALPVLLDDKAVACLMLYDRNAHAFDGELVTLLEEITRILTLVLQGIETENRRADEQERRRRSEERFRSHFESLPIATYVVHEATGQVRRVNRAFINLFGYESYDVPTLEASFERFFADPVYRAQTFEVFRRDTAEISDSSSPRRSREYTIRCRDGSERVVQAIVTRTADELIIGWVDLTELRTSQTMLREAQRIARLGSWSYDFRTRTRALSEDTIELFDIDRAGGDIEGMMAKAFTRADLVRLQAEFFRAIRENLVYEVTVPLRTRRGERRHVLIRARVEYDDRGFPLLAVGSAQDVTSQVEAANELARYREHLEELVQQRTEALASANSQLGQALQEADTANRAKSAFLAVMSHEIRTPLNGVIGMAEVLAQSPLPTRDAEAVRIIRSSATNLLGIIDDILDFSKIEAGRIELERMEASLSEMVEGIQTALAPVADARGVDVSVFIAPDLPDRVITDALRVRQICYNLVGNAIKFSGGRADVRGRVAIRFEVHQTEPLQVRFSVLDNGIGMSPETISHLFTSFTQAELSTTRRFGGTGLGLAICKRLTELFGGTISVTSQLGVGSTFSVVLPMEASAAAASIAIDVLHVPCVILRDPAAPFEADDIAAFLRHAGAHCTIADDFPSAIDQLHRVPKPAVLIRRTARDEPAGVAGFTGDDVRSLHLTEGRRRVARVMSPELVTLDRQYLRSANLLRAVAIAAGRASPEILNEEAPVQAVPARRVDPVSVEQARAQRRLILVAEDDEVNQKVILQQLELLGYAAEVAVNGAEALRMWKEREGYALLLTDLHMPQMDGYELTRHIREAEAAGEGQHLPIVALTANALRGEELRAREKGMDDFLTKPVLLDVLKRALGQWVQPADGTPQELPPAPIPSSAGSALPTLNVEVLKGLVGDDPDVIVDFLQEYRQSATTLSAEARLSLAREDLAAVAGIFHKLKSSSRSVGALSLGDLSHKIELAARDRDEKEVQRLAGEFEPQLTAVMNALSAALP